MRDCEPSARGICRRLPKTGSSGPSLCFRKLGSFVSADGPSKLRLLIGMNRMIGTVINQPCRFIIPIIRASYGMHGDELTQGIARLIGGCTCAVGFNSNNEFNFGITEHYQKKSSPSPQKARRS